MLCQILLNELGTSAPTEVLFSYLNGRIEPGDRFLIIDEMVYHFLEPAGEDPAALVVSFPFSCLG